MDAMKERKRRDRVPAHLRPVPEGRAEDQEAQRREDPARWRLRQHAMEADASVQGE